MSAPRKYHTEEERLAAVDVYRKRYREGGRRRLLDIPGETRDKLSRVSETLSARHAALTGISHNYSIPKTIDALATLFLAQEEKKS